MSARRTAAKLLRFHEEELARITAVAQACGRTPARFLRETALGALPRPRPHAATAPVLAALARIGRTLDQLAHVGQAGQDAGLAERIAAARERHEALVRQLVTARRRAGTVDR